MRPAQEPVKVLGFVNGNALLLELAPEDGMIHLWTTQQQVIDIDIQEQLEWLHPIATWMICHCNTATRHNGLVQVSFPMTTSFRVTI